MCGRPKKLVQSLRDMAEVSRLGKGQNGRKRAIPQQSGQDDPLDPPLRIGIDKVLLLAEDDHTALRDEQRKLRPLARVELRQVDTGGDLGTEARRDVPYGRASEERLGLGVAQRLVSRVDVLERFERRELESRRPFGEETLVFVRIGSSFDSRGAFDLVRRELVAHLIGRSRGLGSSRRHVFVSSRRRIAINSRKAMRCRLITRAGHSTQEWRLLYQALAEAID